MSNLLTYEKIINFSNALDEHILQSDDFFDDGFLNLVEKHLGYSSCSFVCYESNSIYKNSVGHNISMGKDYQDNFQSQDPFAKYISQNYDELRSREINIIKSSEAFADYHSSEFHKFLKTYVDLSYIAVIPFENLRLSFYKSDFEGDFDDDEVKMLYTLEKILISKYVLFSKIVQPKYANTLDELKSKFLDTLSTGVVILNERYDELESNNIGKKYMAELSPALSISSYFSNLMPLLNIIPIGSVPTYIERIVKLDAYIINIRLCPLCPEDENDSHYVYFVTIQENSVENDHPSVSADHAANMETINNLFAEKYGLSPRETEIVEELSHGSKYQDLADKLFISINTVRTHVKNIYRKLEISNQRNLLYIYNQFIQDYNKSH